MNNFLFSVFIIDTKQGMKIYTYAVKAYTHIHFPVITIRYTYSSSENLEQNSDGIGRSKDVQFQMYMAI